MEIKNEFGEEEFPVKSMILVIRHDMKDVRSGIKKGGSCINEKDLDEEEKERKKEGEVKAGNEGTSG